MSARAGHLHTDNCGLLLVQVTDISKTSNDRFAKAVRRSLSRQYGVRSGVTAVFSTEQPPEASMSLVEERARCVSVLPSPLHLCGLY